VKCDHGVALVFDKQTWKLFEDTAAAREQSAQHMSLPLSPPVSGRFWKTISF
jgi:hypothetical protein